MNIQYLRKAKRVHSFIKCMKGAMQHADMMGSTSGYQNFVWAQSMTSFNRTQLDMVLKKNQVLLKRLLK